MIRSIYKIFDLLVYVFLFGILCVLAFFGLVIHVYAYVHDSLARFVLVHIIEFYLKFREFIKDRYICSFGKSKKEKSRKSQIRNKKGKNPKTDHGISKYLKNPKNLRSCSLIT